MSENKKVLIVDDEPKNLKILKIRLKDHYEVIEGTSGKECLELVTKERPSLVLLDVMMEGVSGYEVCETIKKDPELLKTKVILVTGKAMITEKLEGYERGADDYLTKPFNGEELKAKVRVFVSLFNLEKQLLNENKSLESEVQLRTQQLMKTERLAYIGINTAEVVHNLKNPLAVINGLTHLLKRGRPSEEIAEKLAGENEKLLAMVKTIMTSTQGDFLEDLTSFCLNKLIEKELDFLKMGHQFRYEIKIQMSLDGTQEIIGNPVHFQQVIGNLFKNAAESMQHSKTKEIRVHTFNEGGDFGIRIEDTGEGIDPYHLKDIFNADFSTKKNLNDPLSGSGLGLAFCKKMIENYGGSIEVFSEVEKGTCFKILIPKSSNSALKYVA